MVMAKAHNAAKKIVRDLLNKHHVRYIKLTSRTVSFSDLARGTGMFVRIHGLRYPEPGLEAVKKDLKGTGVLLDPTY
jgi:hypothetical protein